MIDVWVFRGGRAVLQAGCFNTWLSEMDDGARVVVGMWEQIVAFE
jgi:hypothetical protein